MPSKVPTMKDVARMAGVSVQTVSCVINGTGSISDETRKQVLAAVERLNYRRDPIARSMRTGQTSLIELLILDITNPVLATVANYVEAAAYRHNYSVVFHNVGRDAGREHAFIESAATNRLYDGLIIVNAFDHAHTFPFLKRSHIPTVLIDCLATPTLPSVSMDNVQGAYVATAHAIEHGHRQIAHICGSRALEVARQREKGYLQALADYGLTYSLVEEVEGERWSYQSGYLAMQRILQYPRRPTAVFVSSDQMAIGAYRALTQVGLSIPEDMSIIGFDDIEAAAFASPPLTTIRQPLEDLASQAVALLLKIRHDAYIEPPQILLPPELVIRQSVADVSD